MSVDLKTVTIEKLKATAYDIIAQQEQSNIALQAIHQELAKRIAARTPDSYGRTDTQVPESD